MKRIAAAAVLLAASAAPARAQGADPVELLHKRVESVAKKVSDAFVFLPGGSGVLISDDGWFLTNHHVIAAGNPTAPLAENVNVNLSDARTFRAKLVCTDSVGDIALLKLESEAKLPFVEFADSDAVQIGQYAVAVGNPLGMGTLPAADKRHYPTVSLGIVSCMHRFQDQYTDCIQTDAAVNPGNSGGPLVDLDGKLIGINGRIATRFANRVNSGVGWAIPSNQIREFLPTMKTGGLKRRVYHGQIGGLGVSRRPNGSVGALVENVQEFTPAARQGFKSGDVIVAINGNPVTSYSRFMSLVGRWPYQSEVQVAVKRGDEKHVLKVVLDRAGGPDIMGRTTEPPKHGGYLGVKLESGKDGQVLIEFVREDSPADLAGLSVGDAVLEVEGRKVVNHETVLDHVNSKKPGEKLRLKVLRGGKTLDIEVTLGRKSE